MPWRRDARRLEAGTPNFNGILAISEGVSLILELGIDEIADHIAHLEKEFRSALVAVGVDEPGPHSECNRSGIVCLPLPDVAPNAAADILAAHGVVATVHNGYLRISFDFFNTEDHARRAAAAVREIMASTGHIDG